MTKYARKPRLAAPYPLTSPNHTHSIQARPRLDLLRWAHSQGLFQGMPDYWAQSANASEMAELVNTILENARPRLLSAKSVPLPVPPPPMPIVRVVAAKSPTPPPPAGGLGSQSSGSGA